MKFRIKNTLNFNSKIPLFSFLCNNTMLYTFSDHMHEKDFFSLLL